MKSEGASIERVIAHLSEEMRALVRDDVAIALQIELGQNAIRALNAMLVEKGSRRNDPANGSGANEVAGEVSFKKSDLSTKCRAILQSTPNPLTVGELCSQLIRLEEKRRGPRAGLDEVCAVLDHLQNSGEVTAIVCEGLRKWVSVGRES